MYDGDIRNRQEQDDPEEFPAIWGETRFEMIERMRRRIRNRLDAGPQRPCDYGK